MTNEEASIIIGNIPINGDGCYSICEYQRAKARAIEALEQQPCDDCISRQAVLDLIIAKWHEFEDANDAIDDFIDEIRNDLPPVTLKEKSEYEHDHEVVKAYNDGQAYILDKIRAEIEQESQAETLKLHWSVAMGLNKAIDIIDKYRESEDKK